MESFTVNRDTGRGKRGGVGRKEGSVDCVESLGERGEAGKGDADTRMSSGEKRRRGWENIWGGVKEANKNK